MLETIKPYLELIYFVTGGPVLALFAFMALRQITVAKKAVRTSSLREAYQIAANQVHIFATEIVPLIEELDKALYDKDYKFFSQAKATLDPEGISIKWKDGGGDIEEIAEISPLLYRCANRLEVFSVYFTSKLAAEDIAYYSCGATFLVSVDTLMPFLVFSADETDNHKNVLKMYRLWSARKEREGLEKNRSQIEKKLVNLKSEVSVPVGAE